MPNIQINIKDKVARGDGTIIVCGNSDYVAHFDFDSEWDEYTTKTAHFEWGGRYEDRVFTGNECAVPVVYSINALTIGVFAGDIRSTTPAFFKCVPCGQDSDSIPADPTPDVYNQLMELLNKDSGVWYPAVDDAGNMSWTRSMSETEPQPVNIKGPKGDAGADGVGIPGTDGKDGVDGKSAYELAQDNGFQGTMQEWLASLVGADGANGADGNDGVSPTVSVAAIAGGNRVTITDAEGAKTFDVMDGAQGASGADGKDYVLTDADKQEIAETAAGLVDVPSVQSDWNQNDSTQPDYVKNRPFYMGDPVETVLVEESTVSFADDGGVYMAEFRSTFSATVGEIYKVYWDGAAYECTCADFNGSPVIGNLSIAAGGSDTGEPFIMLITNGAEIAIGTADTSASHTFSISGTTAPIVKIPAKYIDKNSSGYVVIHSKDTMTQQEAENYRTAISTKEVAFIIWNGMCISGIYGATTGFDLQLTTQNGEVYSIKKNTNGLFAFSGRKFSEATFPNGAMTGDVYPPTINFYKEKIRISPDATHAGVGSTDVLFQVQPNGTKSKAFDVLGNGEAVAPAIILYSSTADSTKKFRITVDDSGTPTIIDESDSTNTWKPTNLPTVTASDTGKFLRVSDTGEWVAETILSASGVSF